MRFTKTLSLLFVLSLYLGLYRGHLAIFSRHDPRPLQMLPYDASIFSEADQLQLKKGIPFSNAIELSRLLEDYTS